MTLVYCDCQGKQILVEGDWEYIAEETFCPIHGYANSCWECSPRNNTTESCRQHRQKIGKATWDKINRQ